MVTAVLKMYFIGTALSVLAALFGLVDSFGGLMYVQDHDYVLELEHHGAKTQTRRRAASSSGRSSHGRGSAVTKRIGS